ncbi:hypothetical protein U4960_00675 [Altererythrobacter sp. H2]|nr:hypothetical protein [Altererythrobacter sp. H2]WRK95877.1 hypothetical protein U4960_00675 [Altererythrobacter sp. H2]
MAHALALARNATLNVSRDWLRPMLVVGCGLALVFARQPLPF